MVSNFYIISDDIFWGIQIEKKGSFMSYHIPTALLVFVEEGGTLENFWKTFEKSEYFTDSLHPVVRSVSIKEDSSTLWNRAVQEYEASSMSSWSMLMVLTDVEEIQRFAVTMKLKRKEPTIVMRWWDEIPELEKSYRNRLIFNRYTGINFIQNKEQYDQNAMMPKGRLKLDNPVLLDQPVLLNNDSDMKVMRHTLLSISEPDRVDIFGQKKKNYGEIRLTVATHFYCNQENIDTIVDLLEHYSRYNKEVLDHIQFVIVDDGSPIEYDIPKFDMNLTWIKIDQDIRWNQSGAKNLCMLYARSNNVVISDVDHLFPEHTLEWLSQRNISHKRFYKLYRKRPDGTMTKGHPNLFYLSRARWFELYGMDEEFAGAYGAEDFRFVKNFKNHGTVQRYLPKRFYCEIRKVDREKSYHSLVRDLSFNTSVDTRKRMEADYFGADFGYSRSMFNYTWHILSDSRRKIPVLPPLDRTWRPRWLLRQLATLLCG